MLEKNKIGKMIQSFLSGKLELNQDQFKTLTLTYNSLNEQIPTIIRQVPIIRLRPPRVVPISKAKVKKNPSMVECISEMLSNSLFIQMQIACEGC